MSQSSPSPENTIAFQGQPGAYSHLACREARPDMEPLACESFESTFEAVSEGRADLAMIPIENSLAGRVADIHHLMPASGLHIVAEHFQRVHHHLLVVEGATVESLRSVHSHIHALSQCRNLIRSLGLKAHVHADTAGAAAEVAARKDPAAAAVASALAGEIYGLVSLKSDFADAADNTTRFVVLAREPMNPDPKDGPVMTTFV
ncbi:MAG: prephenate dehydratase domain-containing protein, partial [Alphaproteobacteria bacterium]